MREKVEGLGVPTPRPMRAHTLDECLLWNLTILELKIM